MGGLKTPLSDPQRIMNKNNDNCVLFCSFVKQINVMQKALLLGLCPRHRWGSLRLSPVIPQLFHCCSLPYRSEMPHVSKYPYPVGPVWARTEWCCSTCQHIMIPINESTHISYLFHTEQVCNGSLWRINQKQLLMNQLYYSLQN